MRHLSGKVMENLFETGMGCDPTEQFNLDKRVPKIGHISGNASKRHKLDTDWD